MEPQHMNRSWKNDTELFALVRAELYSAVVGDIMDQLGLYHQFLPPRIRPLRDDMFVAGRAMPVWEQDISPEEQHGGDDETANRPFGLMLEALDDLQPGEVYVCGGSSPEYALWGELMSACAMNRGAVGAVMDGYARDTHGVLALNFPCFSYGPYAQDQGPRGRVVDFRCSIQIGQVKLGPGDILVGDVDGVCVVPGEAEEEVFRLALEKARGERTVLKAIQNGMGAVAAFEKYGIM
jgi:regulator of RNase E activity RraA